MRKEKLKKDFIIFGILFAVIIGLFIAGKLGIGQISGSETSSFEKVLAEKIYGVTEYSNLTKASFLETKGGNIISVSVNHNEKDISLAGISVPYLNEEISFSENIENKINEILSRGDEIYLLDEYASDSYYVLLEKYSITDAEDEYLKDIMLNAILAKEGLVVISGDENSNSFYNLLYSLKEDAKAENKGLFALGYTF